MKKTNLYWFLFVIVLTLNACGPNNPAPRPAAAVVPTSTATPIPTALPTETPTATVLPTATPFLHPLQIEAMRARDYPGSDIVVEQVLDPGVNYSRYYVSYQ